MTRPGTNLIRALVALAAGALAVPFVPDLRFVLLGMLGGLLALALFEARALSRVAWTLERAPAVALPLGEEVGVPMLLSGSGARTLRVEARQTWPRLVDRASLSVKAHWRPGRPLPLELSVRGVERGTAELPPLHVAATAWGLAERIVPVGAAARLSVLPNLRAVARISRKLDRLLLRGLGSRAAATLGKGRDFDRLREYVPGDELRDVAWKASARHGKLITQQYRLDRSQDVLVCLDRGHRMAARVAGLSKLDHAVNAAVVLAWTCHRMEDRVGLLSFGADVEQGLGQGRGSAHLRQVVSFVTDVAAEHVHSDYRALAVHLRRRLRHRTLVLVLTTLPESEERSDVVKAVSMLAPQHLPLVMVLTDPDLEAIGRTEPSDEEELWRSLVARDVLRAREQVARELRQAGALVVMTAPADAGIEAANAYLSVKRRQLL